LVFTKLYIIMMTSTTMEEAVVDVVDVVAADAVVVDTKVDMPVMVAIAPAPPAVPDVADEHLALSLWLIII
jgi:hypothetical protein